MQGRSQLQAITGAHVVFEKADQSLLKVKLEVKYIDSIFINNRYCHSHWYVEDMTAKKEISHAAWYYDVETNKIVIVAAIPEHTYRIVYNDVLFS